MSKRATILAGLACLLTTPAWADNRPNILLILVDDMGFSDIGCYGGEIPTPNIDALAAGGVRFTQFYNTARCSTTRASLLTGLYPHQAGMGYLDGLRKPESKGTHGRLHERCVTLAEVLGDAGYHTSIVGKWHLGQQNGTPPWERGFQRTASTQYGELYFPVERGKEASKYVYLDGRKVPADSPEVGAGAWYSTFLFTDWALKFVDDAKSQNKPFFLYFAHGAPHFPLKAPPEVIAKYRGRYKAGWDRLRETRHQRQIELGIVDPKWPLSPRPEAVPAWDSLSAEDQDRFDQIMAVYAAMLDCIDQSVGRMVQGLQQRGMLDNTLILFLSDNGGNAESGPRGITEGEPLGGPDSNVFLGMCWATLSNTPFRRYKHFTHEGGISTPLIAHWPAGIPAGRNGCLEGQPGHLIDIMATAVDLTGAAYPAQRGGQAILPMEGTSLAPALKGQPLQRGKPIFWEHEGNRGVRSGPWKLVMKFLGPWELYNIDTDRTEQQELAAEHPDKVRELADQWEAWAAASFVDPWEGLPRTDWGHEIEPVADPPQVQGRGFTVHATVESAKPQGVVLAHGGTAFGYSLYFADGKPAFAYRNQQALTTLTGESPVSGRVTLQATVDEKTISLAMNGQVVASQASPGLLQQQPAIGLYIGVDGVHPVGDYPVPNAFQGQVLDHKVAVLRPKVTMRTTWGERVTAENVWQEYPRPGLRRGNWMNLNGDWDYAVTAQNADEVPRDWQGKILVPFAIEAPLSGVEKRLTPEDALWYRRTLTVQKQDGKRYLLNFEAVDYQATVWINGVAVGRHTGGNLPFSFDITDALASGENTLVVRVTDATDTPGSYQLHGKQVREPQGIWYTPVTGIWQTVWLEEVPALHLTGLKIVTRMDGSVSVQYEASRPLKGIPAKLTLSLNGRERAAVAGPEAGAAGVPSGQVAFAVPDRELWSPDSPTLYDLEITVGDDVVNSYLGFRETGIQRDGQGHLRFTLNGQPLFHWGTLDQGWWPDGLLTPPSDEAMRSDIEFLKAAGFNTIRKHIKVEPRRYYYHCDRLGMMMWQDQVSSGVGSRRGGEESSAVWTRLKPDPVDAVWPDAAHQQFMAEWKTTIDTLHNHPCIVQWVPFNEAWGQHRSLDVGRWTMAYDSTRQVNIASGGNWFPVGQVVDHHQYPHPAFPFELGVGGRFDGYVKVVGEFGGHGYPVAGHLWDPGVRNWGYGGLPKDRDEWLERYRESIRRLAELKQQGIAAGIYTQTTDVEGEINGLVTYDRKVVKLPAEELAKLHRMLLLGTTP